MQKNLQTTWFARSIKQALYAYFDYKLNLDQYQCVNDIITVDPLEVNFFIDIHNQCPPFYYNSILSCFRSIMMVIIPIT